MQKVKIKKRDFKHDPYMRRELLYIALAQVTLSLVSYGSVKAGYPSSTACLFRNDATYIRMSVVGINRRKKKAKSRKGKEKFDAPKGMVRWRSVMKAC